MTEPRKKYRKLIDYAGNLWLEGANDKWSCYNDSTGITRSNLPPPDEATIALDADEVNGPDR